MPELPEVETIRRQLGEVLVGQRVKSVEVRRAKSFIGDPESAVGMRIADVGRKAKVLILELGGELNRKQDHRNTEVAETQKYLLVHLKMTGQLVYQETVNNEQKTMSGNVDLNDKLPRFGDHKRHFKYDGRIVGGHPTADWVAGLPNVHTRVIVEFNKGRLFFNDMRVFGWIRVMTSESVNRLISTMPADIIDREMTPLVFWKILQSTRRPVKVAVMDNKKIGGVGNIYANDGLWEAEIDPRRAANSLIKKKSDGLLKSLKKVVRKGIKYGGASASDDKFVQASGLGGKYQEHFLVYEREGEKCKRCGGVVGKIKLGGRGTYYCPECQL